MNPYTEINAAQHGVIPGVLLSVHGIGLLLTGQSNAGKSSLALQLVQRGHALIADDAPLFTKVNNHHLEGTALNELQDFLCVPPLGVLNIRKLYGDKAIQEKQILACLINLDPYQVSEEASALAPQQSLSTHLGCTLPVWQLSESHPAHRASLVECIASQQTLLSSEYNAYQDFIKRQQQLLLKNKMIINKVPA